MIGVLAPLAWLVAALIEDAKSVRDAPIGPRISREKWLKLTSDAASLPLPTRKALGERWLEELPENWTAWPDGLMEAESEEGEEDEILDYLYWFPREGDPDAGFWHVTTRLGQVWESGALKAPQEVGSSGLGGGFMSVARDMVSVTVSHERARTLQRVLRLAVLAARGEIEASDLGRGLMEALTPLRWWRDPDYGMGGADPEAVRLALFLEVFEELPADWYYDIANDLHDLLPDHEASKLLNDVRAISEEEEGSSSYASYAALLSDAEDADKDPLGAASSLLIANVEGNSWIPMSKILEGDYGALDSELAAWLSRYSSDDRERIRRQMLFEMVTMLDMEIGRFASPAASSIGLTVALEVMARVDPNDIRILRVAARKDATFEAVVQELELRFYPQDIALSPVVYGGLR